LLLLKFRPILQYFPRQKLPYIILPQEHAAQDLSGNPLITLIKTGIILILLQKKDFLCICSKFIIQNKTNHQQIIARRVSGNQPHQAHRAYGRAARTTRRRMLVSPGIRL